MKAVVLLSLLLFEFWSVSGYDNNFRCLLFQGKCVSACPRNMHAYHTRCDRDTVSQRTCTFMYTYTLGFTCGWSRCDCNGEYVLDEDTGQCLLSENCPEVKSKPRGRRRKYRPKKLDLKEPDDPINSMI